MTDTGRLNHTLRPRTQRIVYGESDPSATRRELELTSRIDLAHVVMLAETGLLPGDAAAMLLASILRLRSAGFEELLDRETPRGLYLMYESHLISELGAEIGGKLHTGRSRNDIKATITAIRLRDELTGLLGELLRLQAVLLARSRIHSDVVMPIHTHFQPAMPITYGYYLAGIATALDRDMVALRHELTQLRRCPLGAGAVAGTELPIRPERTAELLGFAGPPLHATDAVAARDTVLRAVASVACAGVTLSRLGTDLQLWSSQEFGFLEFPERLVGGSSAMPQKRNAFLLEHLKAKAATAIGAWTAAASAMKSTPFTNSIEVGTEAVHCGWAAFDAVRDGILLSQVLVTGARPVPERMETSARTGFVTATVIANRLVSRGVPFRTAHHLVGAAVAKAVESGHTELPAIVLPDGTRWESDSDVPLADLVGELDHGGGPGGCRQIIGTLQLSLAGHWEWLAAQRERQLTARTRRDLAVQAILTHPDLTHPDLSHPDLAHLRSGT